MATFDATRLMASMDILVLQRTAEGGYREYGSVPEWLDEFREFVIPGAGNVERFSIFLSAFLDTLDEFWQSENGASHKKTSDWWTKISKQGTTHYFQATALAFPDEAFLLLSHATSDTDLFKSLQKYKVGMLALEKLRVDYNTCRTELSHFKEMTVTDALSGLSNQTGFFDKGQKALQDAETHKKKMLVLSVGLDGLFQINERFGISEGSRAIRTLGGLLKNFFNRTDVLARFGGGEYMALIEETALNNEKTVISRLREHVADYNESSPKKYGISVSVGLIRVPDNGQASLETMVREAGVSMNEEKQAKKYTLLKTPSR
ncbi:MAG: hypothetical protein CSA22_04215 [Deltaproteobacteria bacterium]|nr:MAG: hypothetical protein CSA22_04215 [Deltaproteobacteria bacterium]